MTLISKILTNQKASVLLFRYMLATYPRNTCSFHQIAERRFG